MFLVPIVICMLVKGITSMDSPKTLGRIGLKFVAFLYANNHRSLCSRTSGD